MGKTFWFTEHKFTRYNNSKMKQAVEALGAIELLLPELYDDIFDLVDSKDLTFREALEHDDFSLSNQSRVFGWIDAVETEFSKAAIQLGLE